MAPFYRGWMETVKLDTDDVKGIQSIYGRRKHFAKPTSTSTTTTTTTTDRTTPSPRPTRNPFRPLTTTPAPTGGKDVCEGGGSFDAGAQACCVPILSLVLFPSVKVKGTLISHSLQTADGSYYVFRGDLYWKVKLSTAGIYPGYPRSTRDWSGLPGNIDAAFYNPSDKMTYIFRNNQG